MLLSRVMPFFTFCTGSADSFSLEAPCSTVVRSTALSDWYSLTEKLPTDSPCGRVNFGSEMLRFYVLIFFAAMLWNEKQDYSESFIGYHQFCFYVK